MTNLPVDLRSEVIRRLYADADRLDWENLGDREKSRQYAAWLEDEAVGERLLRFNPSEGAVRVWIKDGPMKEYARARLGVGSHAKYVDNPRCTPESVVAAAIGKGWSVVEGTVEVKPVRCQASGPDGTITILWGKSNDFKYLLFAALETVSETLGAEASIAIIEAPARPTSTPERELMDRMAKRCGLRLEFVNPGTRPSRSAAHNHPGCTKSVPYRP